MQRVEDEDASALGGGVMLVVAGFITGRDTPALGRCDARGRAEEVLGQMGLPGRDTAKAHRREVPAIHLAETRRAVHKRPIHVGRSRWGELGGLQPGHAALVLGHMLFVLAGMVGHDNFAFGLFGNNKTHCQYFALGATG